MHDASACTTGNGASHVGGGEGGCEAHKAAGQRFADTHNIRHNPGRLRREQVPSTAEGGGNLIRDEENAVLVTQLPEPHKQLMIMEPHATSSLDYWFHDEAGDGVVDKRIEVREIACAFLFGCAAGGWFVGEDLRSPLARPQRMHAALRVADGHGRASVAVIAAAPGGKAGALGMPLGLLVLQCHFDSNLDGNRARVRVEDGIEAGAREL